MIKIDGSHGEGGGQIVRTGLTIAAIVGSDLQIENIRAGRKKSGLQPQHLTAARAVTEVTEGRLEGAELGAQSLIFHPGKISAGEYHFDVAEVRSSAGSTGMIFQTLAPILAFAEDTSTIILKGGTHTNWSPPINYIRDVFLPEVRKMGFSAGITTLTWGWYPKGGGVVKADVEPLEYLTGIELLHRGKLTSIKGVSAVSNLPLSIATRQRDQVYKRLTVENLRCDIEILDVPSSGAGTFVMLITEYENTRAGFSALGERGKPSEVVADEAVEALLYHNHTEGAIDPHLADQLVLYMALAKGRSSFTTSRLSRHLLTNIWVLRQFLPLKFEVVGKPGGEGKISVKGVGHQRRQI
ncbi:MAG: RNA 3'-terminal phosphate cyclase [Pseudomonadota bacterium]